jgi:hypothetical protein
MQIRCSTCRRMFEPAEDFSAEDMRCVECQARGAVDPLDATGLRPKASAEQIALHDPARLAADLMNAGSTKFRAKKALMTGGMAEEEAGLAAEAGWEIHRRARGRKLLLARFVGLGIMLLGLALTALFWFAVEGVIIVVFATVTLALAGLVAVIAPDTLESFGDWFS